MPINKNLSGLPTVRTEGGRSPDPDPFIGRTIAKGWLQDNYQSEKAHSVPGTKFRFSMAGNCERALAYYMSNTPVSNPITESDAWRMGLGTMVHEALQEYIIAGFPGAEAEVVVHYPEISGSGHVDLVLIDDQKIGAFGPWKTVVEIKTINGFGFKMAATGFKGPAAGPRTDHVRQAALAASVLNADEVIIAYLSMENVSPEIAARYCDDPNFGRFTAQWSYMRDEFMPIADAEAQRVKRVVDQMTNDHADPVTVPRRMPNDDHGTVTIDNPATGAWTMFKDDVIVDTGKAWNCNYCRYQNKCVSDGN